MRADAGLVTLKRAWPGRTHFPFNFAAFGL